MFIIVRYAVLTVEFNYHRKDSLSPSCSIELLFIRMSFNSFFFTIFYILLLQREYIFIYFMRSIFSIHFMSLHTFIFLPYFYLPFTFFPSFLPSFLPFHFLSFDCYLPTYLPTSLSYFLPFFFSVIHVCK